MENEKTVIGKVVAAILSIFISNWKDFILKLWGKIPSELKTELLKIVAIVNNIKDFVDNPVVDFITFVIPGDADDKAIQYIRYLLQTIIYETNKELKDFGPADYHIVAARLTQELTGMTFGQAAISIENAYQNS